MPEPRAAITVVAEPIGVKAENGFALVAAIALLAALLLISTALIAGAIPALHLASRGTNTSQAMEASEAAADLGWNRLNEINPDANLPSAYPCPSFSGSTVSAVATSSYGGAAWCPSVTVTLPGTSSASYQMSALSGGKRYIVGTATVNGSTQRTILTLNATSLAVSLFGSYAVESESSLDFQNGSEVVGGPVRSDGSIKLEDTQVACHVPNGAITPGPGYTVTETNGAGTCGNSTTAATSKISWQTITAPTSDNDSGISGNSNVTWSSSAKTLTIQNGATLTLTGNTYTFCTLNIQNGTLKLAASNGQPVQIYMLPPSSCSGISNGSQTLTLQNSNSWIENSVTSNGTSLGAYGLQIYVLGATLSYFDNSSSYQFNGVLYAPTNTSSYTTTPSVQIINSSAVKGAVAAYSMSWTASASLTYDSTASKVTGGSGGGYSYGSASYAECNPSAGASSNAPSTNCP